MEFKLKNSSPFYFIVFGIFLIIISPNLFSDGMFMDGLIYSTISHNLSNNLGTFWEPYFSATCFPVFHEHPPLAFGIQSILYTILGNSRYIDKLYSIITFIIVAFLIVQILKELKYKNGWFSILLWLTTPLVLWASSNNILENTLTIFTSLSILFYFRSLNSRKYLFLILSGFVLALGFLTKGFVAFYPWAFPFFWWLFSKKSSFLKMTIETFCMVGCTILFLLLLFLLLPEAETNITKYINTQVINSLKNGETVNTRFFILNRLLNELIPAFSIILLFVIMAWYKKISIVSLKANFKPAFAFFALGLSGVIPIMISMKQSGFYMLSTFPFFAIGFGVFFNPLIENLITILNLQSNHYKTIKWLGYSIFTIGILLTLYFSNKIGRDKNKINDTYTIIQQLNTNSIINIPNNLWQDWSLHGYYARYKNVSLDTNLRNFREFLLIKKDDYNDSIYPKYKIVPLDTKDYFLLKKINSNIKSL